MDKDLSELEFILVEHGPSTVLLVLASILKARVGDFKNQIACYEVAKDLEEVATKAAKFEVTRGRKAG